MKARSRIAKILYTTLLALGELAAGGAAMVEGELRMLPESHLVIQGESNINTFTYRYRELPSGSKEELIGPFSTIFGALLRDPLALKLNAFDAGHKRMNRDLRKLLKADEHPAILVDVQSMVGLNEEGGPTGIASDDLAEIRGHANFTIAGETKLKEFSIKVNHHDRVVALSGDLEFNIEEFGLEAPTAVFGLIKVQNRITVSFTILLKQV